MLLRAFLRWVGVYVRHILEKFDESKGPWSREVSS